MAAGIKCLTCNKLMKRHEHEPEMFICSGCYTHIHSSYATRNMAKMRRVFVRTGRRSKWTLMYGMGIK